MPIRISRGRAAAFRVAASLAWALLFGGAPGVAAGAELALADFNGAGFDYTWGGFAQTPGPTSVRLSDGTDGWGGAGFGGPLNLAGFADGRLVVDFTPQAGNGVSNFTVELIEEISGSETLKSGKWDFNVAGLTPGVPTRLTSLTTLSNPQSGLGDFGSLNLGAVRQWQVLGQFDSTAPFDISFDRIAAVSDAPAPPPYVGAEPNAAWRAVAAQRIDAHRKADLAVSVVDASGFAVPNASVRVEMQQHSFGFGSAVQGHRLRDNASQHAQYKAKVAELFNLATLENDLKWQPWEGEWGGQFTQQGAISALNWLNARGIEGRGHVFVWPGRDNLPADLRAALDDGDLTPAEQALVRQRITDHIAEVGGAVRGRVGAWDVINETRTNNDLMRELAEGNSAMIDWFRQARAADPDADLYINDFGILNSWGQAAVDNRNQYYDTIRYLRDNGAPIDGLGFQGHFSIGDITPPEQLWAIVDRFATLGLDIQVTEFDLNTTDQQLQALYTRDFYTAMFAHEAIDDIIMWGFWENAHWRPDAALFASDWSIKPNGQAFLDLVFDEWWTDETLLAGTDGEALVRAFKGRHRVTAAALGVSDSTLTTLESDGTLVLTLPTLVGDYNDNGRVDAADYVVWRDAAGASQNTAADGNSDGRVDRDDYLLWKSRFGAVATTAPARAAPEPAGCTAAAVLALLQIGRRRRAA